MVLSEAGSLDSSRLRDGSVRSADGRRIVSVGCWVCSCGTEQTAWGLFFKKEEERCFGRQVGVLRIRKQGAPQPFAVPAARHDESEPPRHPTHSSSQQQFATAAECLYAAKLSGEVGCKEQGSNVGFGL
jgi:hypothetical protein